VVLVAASTGRAQSDPASPSAEAALARAEAECADLDYENCAESAMLVVVDPQASIEERTRARFIAGSAQRIIGKDVDARMTFRALILEAPDFTPPDDTPAKVAQFYALVLSEIAGERAALSSAPATRAHGDVTVAVIVESVPLGAAVFVDGENRGVTPIRIDGVPVGMHVLRVVEVTHGDEVQIPLEAFAEGPTTVRIAFRELPETSDLGRAGGVSRTDRADAPPSTTGIVFKLVAIPASLLTGCCAAGAAYVFVPFMGTRVGVGFSDGAICGSLVCIGFAGIGVLGALGFAGWAIADVAGLMMQEEITLASQHRVTITPPEVRGPRRELLFPVDDAVAY
jgi:hypothetical protein